MGLFRRKPKLNIPSTGNAGDDKLLALIAGFGADLSLPRHWIHYVYCGDAEGAEKLTADAVAAGWEARPVAEGFGIVAERRDLAVNSITVVQQREFFEQLAASVPGGQYDGWEAAAAD